MKILFVVLIIAMLVFGWIGFNHFFVKTLMLSDIFKGESSMEKLLISTFDFDTGLTRWDIHQLKGKGEYWNRRINEVNSISDYTLRQQENEKMMQEMLEDPQLKKIVKKILPLGKEALQDILKGLF